MGSKATQADAVSRLVRESVAAVDALAPEALRAVLPALQAARDELRSDLLDWLKTAPDGKERFTAHAKRQALRHLEGALQRVGDLNPAMGQALAKGRKATGPLAVKNLETEISRLSSVFDGGIPTLPQIDIAAVLAQGNKLLWRRHERSAQRYAGAVGADIQHQFAIGVAKGETFEQLVTRLRRLGDPAAKKHKIDPGEDAAGIADGMFKRHRWWAERLVRTEMMNAYNVQHDVAIEQADEQRPEGDDHYLRKWDATADTRLCPLCRELDGTVATIDGTFAGGIKSPPLHPMCRCCVLAWLARWGGMKGEVPTHGPVPAPKPVAAPKKAAKPTATAKKAKAVAKPSKPARPAKPVPPPPPPRPVKPAPAPKPTPPAKPAKKPAGPAPIPALREVKQLEPAAAAVMEHLVKGDLGGATMAIDRMLADRGLVRQAVPNNDKTVIDDSEMGGARAHRKWDGTTVLSSGVGEEIRKYAAAIGTADPQEMLAALDEQASAIYQRRVKIANSSAPKAKKEAALSELNNGPMRERIRDIEFNQNGVKTLIHETLHGFSPIAPHAYQGHGAQIEEVTTEVMARVVGHDAFGIKMQRHDQGSYSFEIEAVTNAISSLTGDKPELAYERLQRASARFKSTTQRLANPHDVTDAFTRHLVDELGMDDIGAYGRVRSTLESHLNEAAKRLADAKRNAENAK